MSTKRNRNGVTLLVTISVMLLASLFVTLNVAQSSITSPSEQYEDSWTHVHDYFLWEDRLADWDKRKTPPKPLRTFAESDKAIEDMLSTLNDKYTRYYPPDANKKRQQRSQKTSVVSWKMLPNNIGYIKIETFSSENCASEVEAALKNLSNADSYIIDLRGNGGGLVWQSFRVFALFTDQGEFQSHKGRWAGKPWSGRYLLTATNLERYDDGTLESSKARPNNRTGDKPIVILVNSGSASASEALAGALRHHRKATLVGVDTFGKGIMQHTFSLDGGRAIKVTTARIYQPDGTSIHGTGLKPDEVVVKSNRQDNQLAKAVDVAIDRVKNGP